MSLALGLVAAAWVVSKSLERIKLAGDRITVKGYAEERVVSDVATWRGTVTVRDADLQRGYAELQQDSARVRDLLVARVGEKGPIGVSSVTTRALFEVGPDGSQTGRVVGHELERTFGSSPGTWRWSRRARSRRPGSSARASISRTKS